MGANTAGVGRYEGQYISALFSHIRPDQRADYVFLANRAYLRFQFVHMFRVQSSGNLLVKGPGGEPITLAKA